MRNNLRILLILLFLFPSLVTVYGQLDSRKLPYFIDAEFEFKRPRLFETNKFWPRNPPPELLNAPPPPDVIQANGVKLVKVTTGNYDKTETYISINPTDPAKIVASANDSRYNSPSVLYKMGDYFTTDAGTTWTNSATQSNEGVYISMGSGNSMTIFDPSLAYDGNGWLYYIYGFCQLKNDGSELDNGVFVSRSKTNGSTWETPVPVTIDNDGTSHQPFNDRYDVAADYFSNTPYKNRIYVTWERFKYQTGVCISYSTDSGDNWAEPAFVGGGDLGETQSPYPAVGPNGEVYVAWQRKNGSSSTDAVFQRSTNGGNSWMPSAIVAQTVRNNGTYNSSSGRWVLADKQDMRVSSYPSISVDVSNSSRRGWIYIVQSGKDNSSLSGVFLSRSSDGGNTWQANLRIDDNPLHNDCFFPSVSVDPVTGSVSVLYYSSQNDPNNKGIDAYLAYSEDGINFQHIRLTNLTWYITSINDISVQGTGNNYWGDYTSITSYNGHIYPCFWIPNGNFYTNNVYVGILSTDPNAPTNLAGMPIEGQPDKLTLTWDDPVFNNLGIQLGDFDIIVYRDNVEIGQVAKGVGQYSDQGLTDGTLYHYAVRARSAGDHTSDADTLTIRAGGELQPLPPADIVAKPDAGGVLLSWINPAKHIDSSAFTDIEKIQIFNGSALVKEITVPDIQYGQPSSVTLDLPQKAFYFLKLKAVGKRQAIETASLYSDSILAYSGPAYNVINEPFDETADTLPYYTTTWGKDQIKAYSSPNSFTDSPLGNYANNSKSYVIMAPYNVTPGNMTLSMQYIALIDTSLAAGVNDYGVTSISGDYGKTWTDIAFYDMRASKGFTGDIATSTWKEDHRSIAQWVNKTIYIRYMLVSNIVKNADGWYIDDLQIDNNPNSVDNNDYLADNLRMNVFPNPASSNTLNFEVLLPTSGDARFEICDIMGNRAAGLSRTEFFAGSNSFQADISKLTQGVYLARITLNGITKAVRFSVVR